MALHVLFATAELTPLARVGGLAEAAGGLVRSLQAQGVKVTVVLPDYSALELANETEVDIVVPAWAEPTRARRGQIGDLDDVVLIDRPGIARPHPYVEPSTGEGWPDNDWRFMYFSAAVASLATSLTPDVIHLNDWHSAAALGFLSSPPPTLLTIHTLGYQGQCDPAWLNRLPHEPWRFAWYDSCNPLLGAIRSADRVVAVSPNYAAEIVEPEGGMGIHEDLARRGGELVGIRNGIDTSIWNPLTDSHLTQTYGIDTVDAGKRVAREELAHEFGWDADSDVILGVVTRLVDQKGIDFITGLGPYLEGLRAKIVLLGSGQAELAADIDTLAENYAGRVAAVTDRYDEPLAHRIFAGSDLFLMPSRFEPCGLAQMQAMAYGTPPVATRVGGLVDTIIDADRHRTTGTGFLTETNDFAGFVDALHRAVRAIRLSSQRRLIQRRAMETDWSWEGPARAHIDLYKEILDEASG